jgi:hypothetical protein
MVLEKGNAEIDAFVGVTQSRAAMSGSTVTEWVTLRSTRQDV